MSADKALDVFKRGDISSIICQGTHNDQHHKLYRGPKYYYYPGWQEPGGVISLIINKQAWESLPNDLQKKMEMTRIKTSSIITNQFESMNAAAIKNWWKKKE